MFRKSLYLLTIFFISIALFACDDNDSTSESPEPMRALTEHDFVNDDSAVAVPEDGVILTHLEHPEAGQQGDTGEQGMDIVPIRYDTDSNHTYCWVDENEDASHFMTLDDLEGNEILKLLANECVTAFVPAGEYELHLHHDGMSDVVFPVFIRPDPTSDEVLISLSNTDADQNLETLLSTNSCPDCDLRDAIIGYTVIGIDLFGVPVTQNNSLIGANLSGADLRGADLRNGTFIDADFSNAILTDSPFTPEQGLFPPTLTGADFSAAVWINGNGCEEGSSGSCIEGKFAFISSFTLIGNVRKVARSNFKDKCGDVDNGLDGGDCICSAIAEDARLGLNYRAWLGTEEGSPSTRFNQSTIPYIRTDGTKIANNYDDLTDGSIRNPIKYSENREEVFVQPSSSQNDVRVWTGVRENGEVKSGDNCINWSSIPTIDTSGHVGSVSFTFGSWTDFNTTFPCDFNDVARIYCFQQ